MTDERRPMTPRWMRWFGWRNVIGRLVGRGRNDAIDPAGRDGDVAIDRDRATALARDVVAAEGRDAAAYDVSVADVGGEWTVAFVGRPPRAPGDELYVSVDKTSGATRTMYGE